MGVSDIVGKIVDKVYDTTVAGIVVENDGYWVKNKTNNGYVSIMPKAVYKVPTIPFYHSAWLYRGEYIKPEVTELRNALEQQYGKVNRIKGIIACPSDALPVDIRMLEETFQLMGMFKCKLVNKTALPAINGTMNYIAISASERLIILELYTRGEITENKYYEKSTFNMEELVSDVNTICYNVNMDVYVFDSTNELTAMKDLGTLISGDEVMEMLDSAGSILYDVQDKQLPQVQQNNNMQGNMNRMGNGGQRPQNQRNRQQQMLPMNDNNSGNMQGNNMNQNQNWQNEQDLQFNRQQQNWQQNQNDNNNWEDDNNVTEQFRRPTKDDWAKLNKGQQGQNNMQNGMNRQGGGMQGQNGMNHQNNNSQRQNMQNGMNRQGGGMQGQNGMNHQNNMQNGMNRQNNNSQRQNMQNGMNRQGGGMQGQNGMNRQNNNSQRQNMQNGMNRQGGGMQGQNGINHQNNRMNNNNYNQQGNYNNNNWPNNQY